MRLSEGGESALHNHHFFAAHRFFNADPKFAVTEHGVGGRAERDTISHGNSASKFFGRRASQNAQGVVLHDVIQGRKDSSDANAADTPVIFGT